MFASHAFLPATSDIPLTLGRKNRIGCFGGIKNLDFEMKGADQSPPRGTQATTGRGRERELRERDGSHKRSRNYSRKLRERTPLGKFRWHISQIPVFPPEFWNIAKCRDRHFLIIIPSSEKSLNNLPGIGNTRKMAISRFLVPIFKITSIVA